MATSFDMICEDFLSDLQAISELVSLVDTGGGSSKSRIASINSATLLLAATFEEFIREMARQFAKEIVTNRGNVAGLPKKLTATAWKRALENMARAKIDTGGTTTPLLSIASEARSDFDAMCRFLEGDITQDIYKHIAHNEHNMRPEQINAIFKVSDLSNVCLKLSGIDPLKEFFADESQEKVHIKMLKALNDFMEKRNGIAHNLNPGSSSGSTQFLDDVSLLRCIASSLAICLPAHTAA